MITNDSGVDNSGSEYMHLQGMQWENNELQCLSDGQATDLAGNGTLTISHQHLMFCFPFLDSDLVNDCVFSSFTWCVFVRSGGCCGLKFNH